MLMYIYAPKHVNLIGLMAGCNRNFDRCEIRGEWARILVRSGSRCNVVLNLLVCSVVCMVLGAIGLACTQ
jgi:hypothetical protein